MTALMIPWPLAVLLGAPVAALAVGFFGLHRRRPDLTHWPILASCAAATAAAWVLAWRVYASGAPVEAALWDWMSAGGLSVGFGLRVDGLNAPVLAMVTLVGALIHVYAVGYMRGDPGFSRFFLYFHFFLFSMLGLLTADNYLQLYVFWEGVGLSSYLLIGFWHDRPAARAAAWKAFLTNRVGDTGFLMAVFLLAASGAGTLRFDDLFARLDAVDPAVLSAAALLLFWAASAKSAQFPLHVWLPDAMEGPTPVSALMHAATMVTAGVFLMARSAPLLHRCPKVMAVVLAVGAATALGAAVTACFKRELKRVLAYSTVSQLGLMMLAIGAGSTAAAVFHLVTHGFFKALLFLCAGNVIHGLGPAVSVPGSANVDEAGGLGGPMPWTYRAFLVGALALAGLPPLAGFFSKDMILEAALHRGGPPLMALALLIAAGSAYYVSRLLMLTFLGARPGQAGPSSHPHEAGAWMLAPVLALAALSAVAGCIGPAGVAGRFWGGEWHWDWAAAGLGVAAAGAGIAAAWAACMAAPTWDWDWRRARPGLEAAVDGEWGWQAFMAGAASAGGRCARLVAERWEAARWDPFTESLADTAVGLGEGLSGLSRGRLNDYLWWLLAALSAFGLMAAACI